VDADGNASVSLFGSSGVRLDTQTGLQAGRGPFYAVLAQHQQSEVPSVTTIATWQSVSITPLAAVFLDDFQQFTNGTPLNNFYNFSYEPLSGPAGATATTSVPVGSPTIVASNFLGSTWAFFDNSVVSNWSQYQGALPQPLTNQVLEVTWKLWIQSTNTGPGMFLFCIPTTNTNANYDPPIVFFDTGLIGAFTNVVQQNLSTMTLIGNWRGLAGTIMTNSLILNFPEHKLWFSLNGQALATLPLGPYWTNRVDAIYFDPYELFPGSIGNRFAIDDVTVEVLSIAPLITPMEKTGTNVLISFTTLPGGFYSVESRDNLDTGTWTVVTNNVAGTGDIVQVMDRNIAGATKRFYHVVKTQ
jgi:hypothetical protein